MNEPMPRLCVSFPCSGPSWAFSPVSLSLSLSVTRTHSCTPAFLVARARALAFSPCVRFRLRRRKKGALLRALRALGAAASSDPNRGRRAGCGAGRARLGRGGAAQSRGAAHAAAGAATRRDRAPRVGGPRHHVQNPLLGAGHARNGARPPASFFKSVFLFLSHVLLVK